jgi:V/A-type H+-transporting ATPase subunit I
VFSNNGLAGLIFYVGILAALAGKITGVVNLFVAPYIIFIIAVPILTIFLKDGLTRVVHKTGKLLPEDEGIGSWILEGFFELFEIVLSFVTNTLSFLRVGGFIISHAGLMMVVMTLVEMTNGAGSIVTLIIGNAFVIALEGFIVGIQVLRLQFYELFSHY